MFLAHYAPNLAEVVDEPESTLETWRAMAKTLPPAEVLRAVDQLGEALALLREGREERLMLELALLKLARPETSPDVASMGVRLDKVEQALKRVAREPRPQATSEPRERVQEASAAEVKAPEVERSKTRRSEPTPKSETPPEDMTSPDEPVWPALVGSVRDELGPRRLAMFREASPGHVEGSTIVLVIPEHLAFHLAQINDDPFIARTVADRASELLGGSVQVVFRSAGAQAEDANEDRAPDKRELREGSTETDPAALVEGLLGGQVIDDLP